MKIAHLVTRLIAGLTVLFGLMAAATVIGFAATGSPSLTVYFAKDFTDTAYQKGAYQRVASSWTRPAKTPAVGSKAVVQMTLTRDGTLASASVTTKSGEEMWDAAALAAVRKAAPFAPLPPGYANPTTEVHVHFEWAAAPAKR
jgi:protein TonB